MDMFQLHTFIALIRVLPMSIFLTIVPDNGDTIDPIWSTIYLIARADSLCIWNIIAVDAVENITVWGQ